MTFYQNGKQSGAVHNVGVLNLVAVPNGFSIGHSDLKPACGCSLTDIEVYGTALTAEEVYEAYGNDIFYLS